MSRLQVGMLAALAIGLPWMSRPADPSVHFPAAPLAAEFLHEAVLEGQPDGGIGQPNAAFGRSMAIAGDTLVVGAPAESHERGASAGAAYVYVRSGSAWSLQQKLMASDGRASDRFGGAVAISGDTVVIGAIDAGPTANGAAYVFVRSGITWTEQEKLVPSDDALDFTRSVALDGDTAVLAAGDPDVAGSLAAYVFVRSGTTWSEQQKLAYPIPSSISISGDTLLFGSSVFVRSGTTWSLQGGLPYFGEAVAISGDTAVVGDPGANMARGAIYVFVRSGTSWSQQQTMQGPPPPSFLPRFGSTVAVSQDTLVVGSAEEVAYVFVRTGSTWSFPPQELRPFDGRADDDFGTSLAIAGDTIVAGSPRDSTGGGAFAGSAYVFERSGTTWSQEQKLEGTGWPGGDRLGSSVAVSGDDAIVGAPNEDTLGRDGAGVAYVFARSGSTWSETAKLVIKEATVVGFGRAVAISGDTAIVGASFRSPGMGAAYVFTRSGTEWTQQQKLVAPDGAQDDLFGSAVAISGDTVVVGAPGFWFNAAYVFVRSGTTWSLQQKLRNTDVSRGAFGTSLAIEGDTIVVGAPDHDPSGGDARLGAAYVFVRSGTVWTRQQKLLASDPRLDGQLGRSVSLSGETAAVGAENAAAYIYVRSGTTWSEQQTLTGGGSSVSVSGDTAVVPAGLREVRVFTRAGTTWIEQQTLAAPEGVDGFQLTLALAGDTLVVGAPQDTTRFGASAGSAHVYRFRVPQADLAVSLADSPDPVVGLQPLTYAVNVTNLGPDPVSAVTLTDTLPAGAVFQSASGGGWTCGEAAGVVTCTRPYSLAEGAAPPVTVVVTAPAAGGSLDNHVSVAHSGDDPVVSNNSAVETTTVTAPVADLVIAKSDGGREGRWGQPFTWTITVSSAGPHAVTNASVADTFPPGVTGVTWTCTASGGASCPAGGKGDIDAPVSLPAGGSATFTATGTVAPGTTSLENTASVSAPKGVQDPDAVNNSSGVTSPAGPIQFFTLTPCRLVDTRTLAAPLEANSTRTFAVGGACGVPADARAAAVILTVVNPGDFGNLRLYPTGQAVPLASAINFVAGHTRAGNAILSLGTGGQIEVQCDMPPGSTAATHFVLDVLGFFR